MEFERAGNFFRDNDSFIITSHESPDADGLGAEYSLLKTLRGMGKKARAINACKPAPKFSFLDPDSIIETLAESKLSHEELKSSTVVLVDTNDIQFIGEMAELALNHARKIFIFDHHEFRGALEGEVCSAPDMSSTCEMVYWTIKYLGTEIDKDIARALFAGIVYDTGSFAYSKTSIKTFEAALDLVNHGAVAHEIHNALYESSDLGALLLRKEVLSSLELELDNMIAIQKMGKEILIATGAAYEEAESLINVPLEAKSVEVSIFFKENLEGNLRCSLRSKGKVNVAHIAQTFSGGGHKRAAGFKCKDSLEVTRKKVIELLSKTLSE